MRRTLSLLRRALLVDDAPALVAQTRATTEAQRHGLGRPALANRHILDSRLRSGDRRNRRRRAVARVLGRQRCVVGGSRRRRRGDAGDRRRELRPAGARAASTGNTPEEIVKTVWDRDPDPRADWPKAGRQFAVIDAKGNVFAYTGPKAPDSASHKSCTAPNAKCTAQGNTLAAPGGRRQHGRVLRAHAGTSVVPTARRARGRSARRRRQARTTVGGDGHREEGRRRVAAQRHRASSASRRQPRADQGAAAPGREGGGAATDPDATAERYGYGTVRCRFFINASISAISRGAVLSRSSPVSVIR